MHIIKMSRKNAEDFMLDHIEFDAGRVASVLTQFELPLCEKKMTTEELVTAFRRSASTVLVRYF